MTIEIRIPQLVICLHSSFIRDSVFEFRHLPRAGSGQCLTTAVLALCYQVSGNGPSPNHGG